MGLDMPDYMVYGSWVIEGIFSLHPAFNMTFVFVKSGYRAYYALNNPIDRSLDLLSLNGTLIEAAASGVVILLAPLLIYCAETSSSAHSNDGVMAKINASN